MSRVIGLILHLDIPGEHTKGADCFCDPLLIYEDEKRSFTELVEELEHRTREALQPGRSRKIRPMPALRAQQRYKFSL